MKTGKTETPELARVRLPSLGLGLIIMLGVIGSVPLAQMITDGVAPPENPPVPTETLYPPPDLDLQQVMRPTNNDDVVVTPTAPVQERQKPDVRPQVVEPVIQALPVPGTGGINIGQYMSAAPIGDLIDSAQLDSPPRPLNATSPRPPYKPRGQVEVVVLLSVDPSGRVTDVEIESTSNPDFTEPVLRAVSRWVFEPGTYKGKPVSFRMRQKLVFD